jgi:SAM-dependent methyltransferase
MRFWFQPRKAASGAAKSGSDASAAGDGTAATAPPPRHKRFLSDQHERYLGYITAAKTYLAQIGTAADDWLFLKPYNRQNHQEFFHLSYNVLNLLGAMRVPPRGRILEVGSGASWLTEILVGLGYEVYALEPSEDMIVAARQRIAGFIQHHRDRNPPPVHHLCESLEECSLADGSVDGIIFHEALHHVVDENRGLAQCFRVLSPDGVLGVTGEGAWIPGDRNLESQCEEEMARYGTLENPYTFEYLQYLLTKHGFEDVTRYHGINGFFPENAGHLTIRQAAQAPAHGCNHLTARKAPSGPTTANQRGATRGSIRVLDARAATKDKVRIQVQLTNCGETAWLPGPRQLGWVRLALYRGELSGRNFVEAESRNPLPKLLAPGESIKMEAVYTASAGEWRLDLVNENIAWFNLAVAVQIPG